MSSSETFHLEHTGWLKYPRNDVVASYAREGWFEYVERAFLWRYLRRGDSFLDIGAHAGFHSATARKIVGPKGRIICVEPNPQMQPYLASNVPGMELAPYAISNKDGELGFELGEEGRSSFGHILSQGHEDVLTVSCKTLDTLLKDYNDFEPAFIKVDIEGAEPLLFSSCEVLRNYEGVILIEFSKENLNRYNTNTENLEALIRAAGFEICIFDVQKDCLVPAELNHPIWYENYVLCHEMEAVNRRLERSPEKQRMIAADILSKGSAAKFNYMAVDKLEKERRQVADIVANLAGLNKHIEENGQHPIKADQSKMSSEDAITELQNVFGVTKSISTYNLETLARRENDLKTTAEQVGVLIGMARELEATMEVSTIGGDHAKFDSHYAAINQGIQKLSTSYAVIEAKCAGLVTVREIYSELLQRIESELQGEKEELLNKLTSLETQNSEFSQSIKMLEQALDNLNQANQERNRYFAGLVSDGVNGLYELKKSKILKISRLLRMRVNQKIDDIIAELSS